MEEHLRALVDLVLEVQVEALDLEELVDSTLVP